MLQCSFSFDFFSLFNLVQIHVHNIPAIESQPSVADCLSPFVLQNPFYLLQATAPPRGTNSCKIDGPALSIVGVSALTPSLRTMAPLRRCQRAKHASAHCGAQQSIQRRTINMRLSESCIPKRTDNLWPPPPLRQCPRTPMPQLQM